MALVPFPTQSAQRRTGDEPDWDDDDQLQITQETPAEALRERVEHAVRRCPKLALSIVED